MLIFCEKVTTPLHTPLLDWLQIDHVQEQKHLPPNKSKKKEDASMANTKVTLLSLFSLSLFLMIIGISVPVLIDPTALQLRLTGIQTTGLVTATGESDRCQYFTYTFIDSHNQVQQITNPSLCESGFVSVGDHVTIWYQQDHPGHMVTAQDLIFYLIFALGFSSPMLLFLAVCCVFFVRGLMKQRRQVNQGETEQVLKWSPKSRQWRR